MRRRKVVGSMFVVLELGNATILMPEGLLDWIRLDGCRGIHRRLVGIRRKF
jgi:hypothetical protein